LKHQNITPDSYLENLKKYQNHRGTHNFVKANLIKSPFSYWYLGKCKTKREIVQIYAA
jgi:hypothetical protein